MKLKKSLVNKTIYKDNMKKFWPVWAFWFGVLQYFTLSIYYYIKQVQLQKSNDLSVYGSFSVDNLVRGFSDVLAGGAIVFFIAAAAIITAALVFSYTNDRRLVYMMHSLPIKRETYFFTNSLTCFTILTVPITITMVMIGGLNIISGAGLGFVIFGFWVEYMLMAVFFLGLSLLIVILSGNMPMSIVIYGVVNILAMALESFMGAIATTTSVVDTFGNFAVDGINFLVKIFTPIGNFMAELGSQAFRYQMIETSSHPDAFGAYLNDEKLVLQILPESMICCLIYALVGILLMVIANACYKKRKMENVGELLTFSLCKSVFKIVFSVSLSSLLMVLFCELLKVMLPRITPKMMFIVQLCCMAVCAVICFWIAEMILEKRLLLIRKKNMKWLLLSIILSVGGVAGIKYINQYHFYENDKDIVFASICVEDENYAFEDEERCQMILNYMLNLAQLKESEPISNDPILYATRNYAGMITIRCTDQAGSAYSLNYEYYEDHQPKEIKAILDMINNPTNKIDGLFSTFKEYMNFDYMYIRKIDGDDEEAIQIKSEDYDKIFDALIADLENSKIDISYDSSIMLDMGLINDFDEAKRLVEEGHSQEYVDFYNYRQRMFGPITESEALKQVLTQLYEVE